MSTKEIWSDIELGGGVGLKPTISGHPVETKSASIKPNPSTEIILSLLEELRNQVAALKQIPPSTLSCLTVNYVF